MDMAPRLKIEVVKAALIECCRRVDEDVDVAELAGHPDDVPRIGEVALVSIDDEHPVSATFELRDDRSTDRASPTCYHCDPLAHYTSQPPTADVASSEDLYVARKPRKR
jgi:hypothetical protein